MNSNETQARAYILTIGDELLLGEITDTNRSYIAQKLLPLGITVVGAETVGDEINDIQAAFHRGMAAADVVLATGGLGPTDDDLTNEALAKTLGVPLEYIHDVMVKMAARLKRPVEVIPESNKRQAMLPKGSTILQNDWGTAPGVYMQTSANGREKHIFLMPGVPREMKGLLDERIIPLLRERYKSRRAIVIQSYHAFGIPESVVGQRIKPLMQAGQNPNVGTRVKEGVVTVRLVAFGADEKEARAALEPAAAQVKAALAEGLFGENGTTLSDATVQALIARKKTIATAESCTGGLIAAALTDVAGSSAAVMEGAVVYSNDAKVRTCGVKAETLAQFGAVSAETAAELADGIRKRAGTSIGLSVTGIAGPGGGSEAKPVGLVFFGIATEKGVKTEKKHFTGFDRNGVRERAAMYALDLIRRAALE
jgi:nicotinamide-nucleotide amidase